jgi:hypothetical protein
MKPNLPELRKLRAATTMILISPVTLEYGSPETPEV